MRYSKTFAFAFWALILLAMTGCGSSGSTTTDPMSSNTTSNNTNSTTDPIFNNVSTANGKTGITLTADPTSVDANTGLVLVTATVVSNGMPYATAPVTFNIVAPINGPATIEPGLTTVPTVSDGTAITRITSGNATRTTDVIVSGQVTIGTQTFIAQTIFQIVRGGGVISFAGKTDGVIDSLTNTEKYDSPATEIVFKELIPFKVTDSNGNPRVGVPIKLDVYSQSGSSAVTIDFLKNGVVEPTANTVTTDDAGGGIFNVAVTIPVPAPGLKLVDSIVFRGVSTNDPIPVTAFGGLLVTSTRDAAPKPDPITISPTGPVAFGTGNLLQFIISGGKAPYTVLSTNPNLTSAVLQPDGFTVNVLLLDSSSWTGPTSFTVRDSTGATAAATPLINR